MVKSKLRSCYRKVDKIQAKIEALDQSEKQVDNELAEPESNAFFMQQHLDSHTKIKNLIEDGMVVIDVKESQFKVDQ